MSGFNSQLDQNQCANMLVAFIMLNGAGIVAVTGIHIAFRYVTGLVGQIILA